MEFRMAISSSFYAASKSLAELARARLTLLSLIKDLGDDYFRNDAAWKTVSSRAESLKSVHDDLRLKLERWELGENTLASLTRAIVRKTKLLNAKVVKLRKSASSRSCARLVDLLCKGRCRPSVDTYLNAAVEAYGNLSTTFKQSGTGSRGIRGRQIDLQPCRDDERYVSIGLLQKNVSNALQDAGPDSKVVIVWGGPGMGKTTLARQISLQYNVPNSNFSQIVVLYCGPGANATTKQAELAQKCGGHVSQGSQGVKSSIMKGLQELVSNPKLLIVLDDVSEPELLDSLVRFAGAGSGLGAKFLVTSRRKDVGRILKCKCETYEVEHLSREDCRKLFASHAGFRDMIIPSHLQKMADEVLQCMDGIPLLLSAIGAAIENAGSRKLEVWNSISNDIAVRLRDVGINTSLGQFHGINSSRSLTATMKISIGLLGCDQKLLLVLISMCRSLSVPIPALQIIYSVAVSEGRCDILNVKKLCTDLQYRQLVASNSNDCLSLHSSTKEVILDLMQDDVKVVELLLNGASFNGMGKHVDSRKASVARSLADLYVEAKFRRRTTAVQNDLPSHLDKSEGIGLNSSFVECKRTIIESICGLLVLEGTRSNEWTEEHCTFVQKVFLDFVDRNCLDQESISKLLRSSLSAHSILDFLKYVCLLENSCWERNDIGCNLIIPQSLSNLLRDSSSELRNQAASVVADLAWSHKQNSVALANAPGMLSQLASWLSQGDDVDLQKCAARAFAACSYWDYFGDGTVIPKMVAEAGLVDSLVLSLGRDENPSLQDVVCHALSNLATARASARKVNVSDQSKDPRLRDDRAVAPSCPKDVLAQWPGLLDILVKLLRQIENPVVQARAASTLANIAGSNENATLERIVNHATLVDELVSRLDEDQNPEVQKQSARAFSKLATYRAGCPIRDNLLRWPGVVENLGKLLLKFDNCLLQANAARALSHLFFLIEKDTANTIVNYFDLVKNLAHLLSESQTSCSQAAAPAVSTLCSLTDVGDDNLRAIIVSSPALLANLSNSLLTGKTRKFEADVVCLMANLAVTNEPVILNILAGAPGLVEKLAQSLVENHSSTLQAQAIRALLNLAGEQNNDNLDISGYPRLLQRLQETLLPSELLTLRTRIVTSLTCLAATKEKAMVDQGVDTWAFLDQLINALSKE